LKASTQRAGARGEGRCGACRDTPTLKERNHSIFHRRGRYADGDVHEGHWKGGDRDGVGTHHFADGRATVGTWRAGEPTGVAVLFSAGRQQAWRHDDGVLTGELQPDEARALAVEIGAAPDDAPMPGRPGPS
jgi:hypothetical protein